MQHHTYNALFTTLSGVVGGVGKAISAKPLLLAILLPGLTTDITYTSESAIARYVVKKIILRMKINHLAYSHISTDQPPIHTLVKS